MRHWFLILLLIVGLASLSWWASLLTPSGIEQKGDDGYLPVVALCTAVVSLFTSVVGLAKAIIEARKGRKD